MKLEDIIPYFAISVVIIIMVIFSNFLIIGYKQIGDMEREVKLNEQVYGKPIFDSEAKCLEFCYPNNYYFSHGGFFGSDDCECKEGKK